MLASRERRGALASPAPCWAKGFDQPTGKTDTPCLELIDEAVKQQVEAKWNTKPFQVNDLEAFHAHTTHLRGLGIQAGASGRLGKLARVEANQWKNVLIETVPMADRQWSLMSQIGWQLHIATTADQDSHCTWLH